MVNLKTLEEIKKEAVTNDIPIMQDDSMNFVSDYIVKHNKNKILEIGTAVGYSAIVMALSSPNVKVVSIERDKERYLKAIENIKKMDLENRITLIYGDALEVSLEGLFDLILIDAAKSQNIKFFEKYEHNLDTCGTIITDNLSFHGFVEKDLKEIESKNVKGMVRKIRDYKQFLKDNKSYKTTFYDLGDTVSVSERRNIKRTRKNKSKRYIFL